ncbi:MAG: PaaI family thioesterase [Burkholderiales bacterium]
MKTPAGKRCGIVDADKLMTMTGLQFVQGLVDGSLPLNTMARAIGYDVVEAAQGRVVVTANSSDEHLNPEGTVHGGVAATLLDTCMGLAVKTMLEQGHASTTLEFKISFLRPVTKEIGLLRAEGTVLSCGRRIGAAEGRLTDGSGRLLAHGTTTCLIFPRG